MVVAEAASQLAQVRQGVEAGNIPAEFDITADLTTAVETLSTLRSEGKRLDEYLAQTDMFGGELSAAQKTIIQTLADNLRSAKAITAFLQDYAQQVLTIQSSENGLFGDMPMPNKTEVLERARQNTNPGRGGATADIFDAAASEVHARATGSDRETQTRNGDRPDSAGQPGDENAREPGNRAGAVEGGEEGGEGVGRVTAANETQDNARTSRKGEPHEQQTGIQRGLRSQPTAESKRLEDGINADLRRQGQAGSFRAETIGQDQLPDALRSALESFRRATGTRVSVFRNLTPEVIDFNGVNFRDGIAYVNETSQHPLTLTAAHEWVHNIRKTHPGVYRPLAGEVIRQGRLDEFQQHLRKNQETRWNNRDVVVEELTAAAVSDALTDPVFLQRLAERNRGVFKKVARMFLDFLKTLTGKWRDQKSNQYLRDVDAFRDKLETVLNLYEQSKAGDPDVTGAMFQQAWNGSEAEAEQAVFSRSAMKDIDANIRRGREALAKAVTEKTTVHRAMHRVGLGWVDFVWGDEGRVKSSGKTSGAMGLAHIFEARQRKDGMSEPQVMRLLDRMVETIARGTNISEPRRFNQTTRVGLAHDNAIVWLTRIDGSNAWVVTAYEERPDGANAGRATSTPTHNAASLTRSAVGAGVTDIVHADRESSQEPRFSRQNPTHGWLDGEPYNPQTETLTRQSNRSC